MHYSLFASGRELGGAEGKAALKQVCTHDAAPMKIFTLLWRSMFADGEEGEEPVRIWSLVHDTFDTVDAEEWPQDVQRVAFTAVCSVLGNLWRRFIFAFSSYPYRLVHMAYEEFLRVQMHVSIC